jgi:hypothetical protein
MLAGGAGGQLRLYTQGQVRSAWRFRLAKREYGYWGLPPSLPFRGALPDLSGGLSPLLHFQSSREKYLFLAGNKTILAKE